MSATRSIWPFLCQQERLQVSEEEQTLPQEDSIDYLRVWNPRDSEELFDQMLAHPKEDVRFHVQSAICWQTCQEACEFDELLQFISDLWLDIKKAEKEFSYKFETMDEAVSWLAEDKNQHTKKEN